MNRLLFVAFAAALLPLGNRAAGAQTLGVTGNPGLLRVSSAVAGSEPIAVSNGTTLYTFTTPVNPKNRIYKITAQLDAAMPAGVTLEATFAAPPGGTSYGPIALDLTARDVVTGIAANQTATRGITYRLVATAAAGVIPQSTRTVTLTILRGP